mgnify:CR=1 FL=1
MPNTTELKTFFEDVINHINEAIMDELATIGEECDTRIRQRGWDESWIDRTGNLRSSIGYGVYDHGKLAIWSLFDQVRQGSLGSTEGNQMVQALAKEYSDVVALVVVAAMDYADKVEALENKDVLESTRIWAMQSVEDRLKQRLDDALEEINKWQL